MQLDEYVRQVQRQLADAAMLGDESVQRIAANLASAVGPAVHLAVMAAVAEAADEITALLLDVPTAPAVSVRLDGDTVRTELTPTAPESSDPRAEDGEATARISLRLSPELKADVESAAGRGGVSVNTWLVRAASSALAGGRWGDPRPGQSGGHRISGYLNS